MQNRFPELSVFDTLDEPARKPAFNIVVYQRLTLFIPNMCMESVMTSDDKLEPFHQFIALVVECGRFFNDLLSLCFIYQLRGPVLFIAGKLTIHIHCALLVNREPVPRERILVSVVNGQPAFPVPRYIEWFADMYVVIEFRES